MQIQLRYLDSDSRDNYKYFINFADLGEWIYNNIKTITIVEINKEIMNWC